MTGPTSESRDGVAFGLLGAGALGSHLAKQIASIEGARLATVFDLDRGRASALAGVLDARHVESVEALIADPDVDAVIVATPLALHVPHVDAALDGGKHVFCEKPFAPTVAECDRLMEKADLHRLKLTVGQVLRLYPRFWHAKEILASGTLGEIRAIAVSRTAPLWPMFATGWRASKSQSGGLLMEMNAHEFDYLRVLAGEPRSVFAVGGVTRGVTDSVEFAFVTVTFGTGVVAGIHSSISSERTEWRIVVDCTAGTLVLSESSRMLSYQISGAEEVAVEASALPTVDPYEWELRSFIDWLSDDVPPLITAMDGRQAVLMAQAAYESMATGVPIALAPRTPPPGDHSTTSG